GLCLLVIVIVAFGWPIVALVRRRYKYVSGLAGRPLLIHRVTRAAAWLYLVVILGWVFMLSLIQNDLTALNGRMDVWMRLLQLVLVGAIIGTLVAIWNAVLVARSPGRHWLATIWAIMVALAAAILGWLCLDLGLLTASLNF
ncbi:MAG TPA: hypothetical protein VM711_02240, partial [Sphingomicrobium sp.]|nr:hypothetical protein [Sphingomicrobium sp.]